MCFEGINRHRISRTHVTFVGCFTAVRGFSNALSDMATDVATFSFNASSTEVLEDVILSVNSLDEAVEAVDVFGVV